MLEIKFLIIIFIIVISSYIGFLKGNVYVEREKEIKNILNSLDYLRNKIEYTNLFLKDIFNCISNDVYKGKDNMFKKSLNSNLSLRNSFKEEIKNNTKINDEDKSILLNIAMDLGTMDKKLQISKIDICTNFLNKNLKDAEELKNKNTKMFKVLGVVSGLVISIILI